MTISDKSALHAGIFFAGAIENYEDFMDSSVQNDTTPETRARLGTFMASVAIGHVMKELSWFEQIKIIIGMILAARLLVKKDLL